MASYPKDKIGIGSRVTWYGNRGTVVAYIPPNREPSQIIDALIKPGEMRLMFDQSKVRDVTSYIIRKDKPAGSTSKPELYRPWGATIRALSRCAECGVTNADYCFEACAVPMETI